MNKEREFPDWEEMYETESVETMPWFLAGLDHDFETAVKGLNIPCGAEVLDLGTGPGTQAAALAKMGFKVTGSDVAGSAIKKAGERYRDSGVNLKFVRDDILDSDIAGKFDALFDRGCFHLFLPDDRSAYVRAASGLLNPGGYLLLKCFHFKETMDKGPYRFSPEDIRAIFGGSFTIHSMLDSVFYGALDHKPKALFCVMEKKGQVV